MVMNPGMLLFGLFDSAIAFFLVYNVTKAKLGGNEKMLARILGASLGTIVFVVYFGIIVWFNTDRNTVSQAARTVVYAAPIILSALMIVLVLLSQPPGRRTDSEEDEEETDDTEEEKAGEAQS